MNESESFEQDRLQISLLVLRCQTGDESAFSRLFARFGPRTLGYLRSLVRDEAEDLQQEVWLTVYRRLAELADPAAFRTWLYRTTRNRAIDHLRRERRAQDLFTDDPAIESVADPGPEEESKLFKDAGQLMESLPRLQREVMLLRYRDELSYTEIAAIAGCSVGTVRSRLFYARQQFAKLGKQIVADDK